LAASAIIGVALIDATHTILVLNLLITNPPVALRNAPQLPAMSVFFAILHAAIIAFLLWLGRGLLRRRRPVAAFVMVFFLEVMWLVSVAMVMATGSYRAGPSLAIVQALYVAWCALTLVMLGVCLATREKERGHPHFDRQD